MPPQLLALIRMSRAYFLPMAALPYFVGVAVAGRELDQIDSRLMLAGLGIELLVQLSVSYFNDYWDMPTDAINTRRTLLSGGSGELTTGVLPPLIAPIMGALCQGGALGLALWAGLPPVGWPLLVLAMAAAVFYTAPPLALAWRGLGEITTATVAGLMVPMWGYSLQTGHLSAEVLVLGLPLVPIIMSMFVAISTPDYEADHRVGKRTLPVLVGEGRVASVYAVLAGLGYLAAVSLWWGRVPPGVLIAAALCIPLAVWAWWGLRTPISTAPRALLFMIMRAALIPAVVLVALNIGLRTG